MTDPGVESCPACGTRPLPGDVFCEQCGTALDRVEMDVEIAAVVSDRGRRRACNEDAGWLAVLDRTVAVVVTDGVSRSSDPARASQTAVTASGDALTSALPAVLTTAQAGTPPDLSPVPRILVEAVTEAARAVADLGTEPADRSAADPVASSAPACTIVAATVTTTAEQCLVVVAWAGDSRAYWVPSAGPALPLTFDDSLASELIAAGADPAAAYAGPGGHVLTDWLGAGGGQHLDRYRTWCPDQPGTLVLCTDGLWNHLPDPEEFAVAVRGVTGGNGTALAGTTSALEQARALVNLAWLVGGHDNVTVAVVPVVPQGVRQ